MPTTIKNQREKVDLNLFSKRLKKLRKDNNNMKPDQLAEKLGCSGSSIFAWENAKVLPQKRYLDAMTKVFKITNEFLLYGTPETNTELLASDTNERSMRNHEGYRDTTASIAIRNVDRTSDNTNTAIDNSQNVAVRRNYPTSGTRFTDLSNVNTNNEQQNNVTAHANLKVGDLVKINGNKHLVIAALGNTALVAQVHKAELSNCTNFRSFFKKDDMTYYVYIQQMFIYQKTSTNSIYISSISEDEMSNVRSKLFEFINVPVADNEADPISLIVKDSVDYINQKKGKAVPCPKGKISLQKAVDLASELDTTVNELVRDHTEDRKLDEIIKMEEELNAAQEKLDEQKRLLHEKRIAMGLDDAT